MNPEFYTVPFLSFPFFPSFPFLLYVPFPSPLLPLPALFQCPSHCPCFLIPFIPLALLVPVPYLTQVCRYNLENFYFKTRKGEFRHDLHIECKTWMFKVFVQRKMHESKKPLITSGDIHSMFPPLLATLRVIYSKDIN